MLALNEAFSPLVADNARNWLDVWTLRELESPVRFKFSTRMFRTVGRCYPSKQLITLAAAVPEMSEYNVRSILCHELAHLAAYELFGRHIKPHGREWQVLMRAAGFPPHVRFDDVEAIALLQARAPKRRRYVHRCPVCAAQRISARRVPAWRCGACYEIGRDGVLEIIPLTI